MSAETFRYKSKIIYSQVTHLDSHFLFLLKLGSESESKVKRWREMRFWARVPDIFLHAWELLGLNILSSYA